MHLQSHRTQHEPGATVLIAHGFAEHQGRYTQLIHQLNHHGFDVVSYDHANHGSNIEREKDKACVDVEALIQTHLKARNEVASTMRTSTMILLGHSMGGLITAASTLQHPHGIGGVILSAPALSLGNAMPKPVMRAARQVARVLPRLGTAAIPPEQLTSDEDVQRKYVEDPLNCVGKVPLLSASTMYAQGQKVLEQKQQWPLWVPLLAIQGTSDEIVNPEGTRELVKSAERRGVDVQYYEVAGGRHEVLGAPYDAETTPLIMGWLRRFTQQF
ncbi:alpha/beta fold hydrolase [Corynebacterium pseudopelargi]|uniref:Phospholipase YtpA n=1 Tax=Corynebacterium pseudopelargi TaxID=2080757 RepID=A0A3G6IS87_9CORY|nr:alpha/beta fold hydrolase [Corynebacterium pseudopelargi]AZA08462.1 Phospholipase YtpA [Corynebacterium pseudopelargi]